MIQVVHQGIVVFFFEFVAKLLYPKDGHQFSLYGARQCYQSEIC